MWVDACDGLAHIETDVRHGVLRESEHVMDTDVIDGISANYIPHQVDEMDCLDPQHEAIVPHELVKFGLNDAR